MERINTTKLWILSIFGVMGTIISNLFGGWNMVLETLLMFMIVDYVTGIIVAGVFHKSKKSETGALSSSAGWRGLCKKCMTLLMVLVVVRLDMLVGNDHYFRDAVAIGFIANELLSILENADLMGVWLPSIIKNTMDMIRKKGDEISANPDILNKLLSFFFKKGGQ